jgi:hypothetical protein
MITIASDGGDENGVMGISEGLLLQALSLKAT